MGVKPRLLRRCSVSAPVLRAASRADKVVTKLSAEAQKLKESASVLQESKPQLQWVARVCNCVSHEATQLLVYIVYILLFQMLSNTLVSVREPRTAPPPGARVGLRTRALATD